MVKPEEQQEALDFMRANIKQARAVGETGWIIGINGCAKTWWSVKSKKILLIFI